MSAKLVPFGRYRGQPVGRMLDDKGYCEWLMKQDWFVERFPDIHVVAMNWGNPDLAQTPDHNAMQAKFLDVRYAAEVGSLLAPALAERSKTLLNHKRSDQPLWYCNSGTRHAEPFAMSKENFSQWETATPVSSGIPFIIPNRTDGMMAQFDYRPTFGYLYAQTEFEVGGWDVKMHLYIASAIDFKRWGGHLKAPEESKKWVSLPASSTQDWYLELKPHISDDYPAIMRQMKKNALRVEGGYHAVIGGSASSQVVTPDQIKAFFATAGFGFLVLDDDVPCWDIPF